MTTAEETLDLSTLIASEDATPGQFAEARRQIHCSIERRGALEKLLEDFPAIAKKLSSDEATLTLELVQNPDLLSEIGHSRRGPRPILVGFALETEPEPQAIQNARKKLIDKRVDLVVANRASESLERDDIRALLVDARDCRLVDRMSKRLAAERILEFVTHALGEKKA